VTSIRLSKVSSAKTFLTLILIALSRIAPTAYSTW
jgi:hypothetical protein